MSKRKLFLRLCACCITCIALVGILNAQHVKKYNLLFNSPAVGSESSMVLGNGDISANAWVDKRDHNLYFYIGKTDSRDYLDRLLKVGKLKVQFSPNILEDEVSYKQEFHLDKALLTIKTSKGTIMLWVDANNPVIVLQANTSIPVTATVITQIWRKEEHEMPPNNEVQIGDQAFKKNYKEIVEADSTVGGRTSDLIFYHRNLRSALYDVELKMFRLSQEAYPNPYKNLTFGAMVCGTEMQSANDSTIKSKQPGNKLEIRTILLTKQAENTANWVSDLQALHDSIQQISSAQLLRAHTAWWANFWNRSYIEIKANKKEEQDSLFEVTRNYLFQRYLLAVGGRGASPIYFNGSTYTVDTYTHPIKTTVGTVSGKSADVRYWGYAYLWQNTRLPYWPMLESGDYEMIQPFLKYYTKVVYPKALLFTRNFKRKPGVSFEELYHSWGMIPLFIYGLNRVEDWNGAAFASEASLAAAHLDNHITCGLELVNYMLDYYEYTQDTSVLRNLLPIAKDVITYFDKGHPRDANGKVLMEGYKALETYNNVKNPVVYIAGLRFVLPRLIKLAEENSNNALAKEYERFYDELPQFSMYNENGTMIIKPGESFDSIRTNIEQPELYSVYPFRLFSTGSNNIATGINTFNTPSYYGTVLGVPYDIGQYYKTPSGIGKRQIFDWNQTGIQAAHLGLRDAAWDIMTRTALSKDPAFRFPGFYGYHTYNYLPDTEHGSVFMKMLQAMLIQSEGDRIYLFPAWPKDKDVKFKLHAMKNTVVEGELKNGLLKSLKVSPQSRKKDIIIMLNASSSK